MLPKLLQLRLAVTYAIVVSTLGISTVDAQVELTRLNANNWNDYHISGKEADAIYGDWVLRNSKTTAVIAQPLTSRNANMTVRRVGGCLIDMSRRNQPNDQLSCYYPLASRYSFEDPDSVRVFVEGKENARPDGKAWQGESISIVMTSKKRPDGSHAELTYRLANDSMSIEVETRVHAASDRSLTLPLRDSMRADRTFQSGFVTDARLFWAYDEWFNAAYGVHSADLAIQRGKGRLVIEYLHEGSAETTIEAADSFTWQRRIIAGRHQLDVLQQARRYAEFSDTAVRLNVNDPFGPVKHARVTVTQANTEIGVARTNGRGNVMMRLPVGQYDIAIAGLGRSEIKQTIEVGESDVNVDIATDACGYAVANIKDENGGSMPCKVSFHGVNDTKDPFFGPDSKAEAVHNTRYAAHGRFRQEIAPGEYDVVISRGPEFDAVVQRIKVERGEETQIKASLVQTVDSSGWVSGEFHSHSTPSGDNTGSQRGRVLNLLAEHIEFAPCTEHNRIDSYQPHLDQLRASRWMATCTGMELTGGPLPVNHQNAFPLIRRPRTQDGGAPLTDVNPVVQIERLAMWDGGSSKLVQSNHPNLIQIFGDANLDREPDAGFRDMFKYMDVVEVHPLASIFERPTDYPKQDERGNTIFVWLQLLNQGFRVPGVVNTDAHYNFHGSGWLRNYIRSSTDDPSQISTDEMVAASEQGNIVMSTGPFMEVSLHDPNQTQSDPVSPGDDIQLTSDAAQLHVRVQCANWLDINRVQVLVNGELVDGLNFTRRDHPDMFGNGVVKFDQKIDMEIDSDAHIIVAAVGEGLTLGRVMGPSAGKRMPVAVSNPIFADRDGNGFQANGDLLGAPLPMSAAKR